MHQNDSNKMFKLKIEAVNTANLYSTKSSSLSLTVDTISLTSWTLISSLILEVILFKKQLNQSLLMRMFSECSIEQSNFMTSGVAENFQLTS